MAGRVGFGSLLCGKREPGRGKCRGCRTTDQFHLGSAEQVLCLRKQRGPGPPCIGKERLFCSRKIVFVEKDASFRDPGGRQDRFQVEFLRAGKADAVLERCRGCIVQVEHLEKLRIPEEEPCLVFLRWCGCHEPEKIPGERPVDIACRHFPGKDIRIDPFEVVANRPRVPEQRGERAVRSFDRVTPFCTLTDSRDHPGLDIFGFSFPGAARNLAKEDLKVKEAACRILPAADKNVPVKEPRPADEIVGVGTLVSRPCHDPEADEDFETFPERRFGDCVLLFPVILPRGVDPHEDLGDLLRAVVQGKQGPASRCRESGLFCNNFSKGLPVRVHGYSKDSATGSKKIRISSRASRTRGKNRTLFFHLRAPYIAPSPTS